MVRHLRRPLLSRRHHLSISRGGVASRKPARVRACLIRVRSTAQRPHLNFLRIVMFNVDDIGWIDFEVFGGSLDLKAAGTFRYAAAASTRAIILAYALGGAPAQTWHADGKILDWDQAPDDLRAASEYNKTFAMWNASFDATIWNHSMLGSPYLPPERVIDVMVQAGVSNLPTDLEHASRYLGGEGKQANGKKLIKMFCSKARIPAT